MLFRDFARAHGLLIRDLMDDGRIHRCATESHPRSRNGAYKCTGAWGWVQDWGTQDAPEMWFADEKNEVVKAQARVDMAALMQQESHKRDAAALRAAEIVLQCGTGSHPYLDRKGFPKETALIDYDGRLVVPMRSVGNYSRVQSLQWIDATGEKKFMPGGAAKGGVYMLGAGDEFWLCEGFATGLSVRAALKSMYRQARVVVCFSAGNLAHVAGQLQGRRYVIADNDESGTGERYATQTGLPWAMPSTVGQDANDLHQSGGVFALSKLLRTCLRC
ncbi:toprim domain-containing protein [Schauerella aestuarii]|uniref:toprim domain-containing protein n=1 Tax=Schauerella aestuarii TaxID=2511204 RepID=UPI00136B531E|nr:toprim domain-containing protein [Achromobacter aestuarii]MYZ44194.1 hypothetical protein [Achromobacter aestuarii]